MIYGIYIIHRKSGLLLLEKKFESSGIDSDLFSSLLIAIRNFASAIHMGELTSFSTHNKKIIISLTEGVIVAIIMDTNDNTEEWEGKAFEIAQEFNETFDVAKYNGYRTQFRPFKEQITAILGHNKEALIVQVAKWANKEFGSDIHINQRLITSSNIDFLIDIIVDRGQLEDLTNRKKILKKLFKGYDREIYFIRIINDIAGQQEIEQFIKKCKDLGYECRQEDRSEQYFDYFPSKIILMARDFSPTAQDRIQEITKNYKKRNKHYIRSNHLGLKARFKGPKTDIFNCYVELWRWKRPYPERIFS